MPDQSNSVSRPWRKFLRFSVRGLIVVVLLVGGWLGWIVRGARIERDAVAAIIRAGGWVRYDSGSTYFTMSHATPLPGASSALWDTIGENYFTHVSNAGFNNEISDRELAEVGRLQALTCLTLNDTNVTDNALAHLVGRTCLSELFIYGRSQLTDAGFAHLKGQTNLLKLILCNTQITDAGLAHLKGMTKLVLLDLRGSRVSDSGLAHLTGLTTIASLKLSNTLVTDAGLVHLKGLKNLSWLDVHNTQVTEGGVKELRRAMPGLMVYR